MYSRPSNDARLLALGELGAGAGRGVEGRDAGGAGADALGHRALRQDFELDLAHARTPPRRCTEPRLRAKLHTILRTRPSPISRATPFVAAPGGVVHDGEVLGALLDQPVDQGPRLPDLGEAGDQHGRAVLDARHAPRPPSGRICRSWALRPIRCCGLIKPEARAEGNTRRERSALQFNKTPNEVTGSTTYCSLKLNPGAPEIILEMARRDYYEAKWRLSSKMNPKKGAIKKNEV